MKRNNEQTTLPTMPTIRMMVNLQVFRLDLQGIRFYKTVIMQNAEGYIRVRITVAGTVQGVGFRYWGRQRFHCREFPGFQSSAVRREEIDL